MREGREADQVAATGAGQGRASWACQGSALRLPKACAKTQDILIGWDRIPRQQGPDTRKDAELGEAGCSFAGAVPRDFSVSTQGVARGGAPACWDNVPGLGAELEGDGQLFEIT